MSNVTELLTPDDQNRGVEALMQLRRKAWQEREATDLPGGGGQAQARAHGYMTGVESVLILALDIDPSRALDIENEAQRIAEIMPTIDEQYWRWTAEKEQEVRGWWDGYSQAAALVTFLELPQMTVAATV